ncbi:nucleoside hydrolase-like domain-containing protein [Pelagicoccus mobilis]|uniref:Cellulose-binding Sde182 nucleoside hydrolase-like domain-containing protein n=1 Tax=Pelagicoccus mobilis TaxID=415221 RepID=A0A934RVR0_9BACT|nr:nucleoside hydrolase-like domain-containing protein [Pelagicoccus mobilis]MBK1877697.1 hypothetical protein [Pelagicoccus mobilis]
MVLSSASEGKPKVWILSDGADKRLERAPGKYITDPDDMSALAGYLLMANMFDTLGIVVGGNANANAEQQKISMKQWAEDHFGAAYEKDLPKLNANIGGYPESIRFVESFLWSTGEEYDKSKAYLSLDQYGSVQALFEEVEKSDELINVLCWGMLTEAAVFVNHCVSTDRYDLLEKVRFISHWTSSYFHVGTMDKPDHVHNAFNDADAAAYLKLQALNGHVRFYECAAIGQSGIVEGSPRGKEYYDQFKGSALGTVYVTGKYLKGKKTVDDSDSATYWVLLGDWGVGLGDLKSNGTNDPETEKRNEVAFHKWSPKMRDELLRRASAASK